jgi:putative transcriptional regulator
MDSLQGNFLIATSHMPDPRFQKQVVYLCSHTPEEGAMGLIINHPTPHSLAEVMEGADIPVPDLELPPIYLGGPVEMEAGFILFSGEFACPHFIQVTPNIRLSSDVEILRDISNGKLPEKYLFALGYAGWAPGQLESELADDGWLALPGDEEVIFTVPDDEKWAEAARRLGIDIATFGDMVGSA